MCYKMVMSFILEMVRFFVDMIMIRNFIYFCLVLKVSQFIQFKEYSFIYYFYFINIKFFNIYIIYLLKKYIYVIYSNNDI